MQKTDRTNVKNAQGAAITRIYRPDDRCRICGRAMDPESDYVICGTCIADIVYMENRARLHPEENASSL